jgi:hypothetical protein
MKKKHTPALPLVALVMLISSCGEAGRYQIIATPPFEGGVTSYKPSIHVLDTKTGVVFTKYLAIEAMATWDPARKALQYDTLSVTSKMK